MFLLMGWSLVVVVVLCFDVSSDWLLLKDVSLMCFGLWV